MTKTVLLLAAAMLASSPLHAREIPAEEFARDAKYNNISISPNGKYLAASAPVEDETRLAIIDRSNSEVVNIFRFGPSEHVSQFYWVGDEKLVMTTSIRLGWLDQKQGTGDMYVADATGDYKIKLFTRKPFQFTSLVKGDPDHIIITEYNDSNYPDLYRVNLEEKRNKEICHDHCMTRIARSPVENGRFLLDQNHVLRAVVGELNDGTIVVNYRPTEDDDWQEVGQYNPKTGSITPLAFSDKPNVMLVESDMGAKTSGLLEYNLLTGEQTVLFRDPDVDIGSLVRARDGKTVIGVNYHVDRPRVHWILPDHPDALLQQGLMNAFPDSTVSMSSYTDDMSEGVVYVRSDTNPGEFFIFNADKGSLSPLVKRRPWVDPAEMASMEHVIIEARDGLPMHAFLTLPSGSDGRNLPFVILPHGGPHGPRDGWGYDSDVQFLANRGYAVLQVNYRGSGGYGREFMYSGYRKWGTTMQDDLTDATLWAVNEGIADKDRMCIYGASYGGYASLMGVVREPDLYQCAIGYVGVYDLEIMAEIGDIRKRKSGRMYIADAIGSDEADLHARSPVRHVEKIKADLFLVHGKEDIRAHYKHYTVLAKALDKADIPYRSMVKKKEAHGFADEDNRTELYQAMAEFLDEHTAP